MYSPKDKTRFFSRSTRITLHYFFTCKLPDFLFFHMLQLISFIAAVVGILAAVKQVTWLVIGGAIVSALCRIADCVLDCLINDRFDMDSSFGDYDDDEIPIFLKLTTPAVVLAVVGMFVLHFVWQIPWFYSFCLCLNAALLLSWIITLVLFLIMKHNSV